MFLLGFLSAPRGALSLTDWKLISTQLTFHGHSGAFYLPTQFKPFSGDILLSPALQPHSCTGRQRGKWTEVRAEFYVFYLMDLCTGRVKHFTWHSLWALDWHVHACACSCLCLHSVHVFKVTVLKGHICWTWPSASLAVGHFCTEETKHW